MRAVQLALLSADAPADNNPAARHNTVLHINNATAKQPSHYPDTSPADPMRRERRPMRRERRPMRRSGVCGTLRA